MIIDEQVIIDEMEGIVLIITTFDNGDEVIVEYTQEEYEQITQENAGQ